MCVWDKKTRVHRQAAATEWSRSIIVHRVVVCRDWAIRKRKTSINKLQKKAKRWQHTTRSHPTRSCNNSNNKNTVTFTISSQFMFVYLLGGVSRTHERQKVSCYGLQSGKKSNSISSSQQRVTLAFTYIFSHSHLQQRENVARKPLAHRTTRQYNIYIESSM